MYSVTPSFNILNAPWSLHLLSSERAALGESGLTAGGLAKDSRARAASHNGLSVRKDGGDVDATGALNVHEEGSRLGDKSLELVLSGLRLRRRVEKILSKNLS